jgi:hypothetical protein
MKGYEDGEWRPENSMTRAEVAVMFARLMVRKMGVNYEAQGIFSDVETQIWCAKEIEFLASLGIIKGYDEAGGGKYYSPQKAINRAEFAMLISRFENLSTSGSIKFNDIESSHWAYEAIVSATAKGWIKGYEDGSFRPTNNVTRAEVVTMVNRMLGRVFDDNFNKTMLTIPLDVPTTHWAFFDILESINSHDFVKNDSGSETWNLILANIPPLPNVEE